MNPESASKVTADHPRRNAYLYVRQSTLRQVVENTESTQRQYALRGRAVALGWTQEQVVVLDSDLGQSGASAADRVGFQKLVSEVGLGRAGLVMGLEVSRLARNSTDWHRLLELCALSHTLILDEDGIYDPIHFNDRLLLGLKGTMSEAELHLIRARLQGGLLNKARRGELPLRLAAGFVYDAQGKVALNPDREVQRAIRFLFETFEREGSVYRTARAFRDQGLTFPSRVHAGPSKGEVVWRQPSVSHVAEVLHNPRYTGAYVYGRRTLRFSPSAGRPVVRYLPQDGWRALVRDAHPGYITWEAYEQHLRTMASHVHPRLGDRSTSPREGPALLQALVLCGRCGARMSVRYACRGERLLPTYECHGTRQERGLTACQSIPGERIDEAVADQVLAALSPVAIDIALAVQQEVQARMEEADRLRKEHVERARYEADLARRRYVRVEPENRLVADTLEADWNLKLREVVACQEEYERRREEDRRLLTDEQRAKVIALATDFPRLWKDPGTEVRDRKQMLRLLLEDVTLKRDEGIAVHLRFKGGATRSLALPRPVLPWEDRKVSPRVLAEIDRLLDEHTEVEIAKLLNEAGHRSGCGLSFDGRRVQVIRRAYRLKPRRARLAAKGWLSLGEAAERMGICRATVKLRHGLGCLGVPVCPLNDTGEYMYGVPGLSDCGRVGPRPVGSADKAVLEVSPEVVAEIDRLLDEHTEGEIAEILNGKGYAGAGGERFDAPRIVRLRRVRGLKSRYRRLREAGCVGVVEAARRLKLNPGTVKLRRAHGRLAVATCKLDDNGVYMYAVPEQREGPHTGKARPGGSCVSGPEGTDE